MNFTKAQKKFSLKKFLKSKWKIFALLFLLVFFTYFNSLGNDFVSDDLATIRDNPLIKKNNLEYLIYHNFHLRATLLFIIYKIFGPAPIFYRLSNIFFHAGSACLLFIILWILFPSSLVPYFSSLIFSVHPFLTEGVTWIAGGPYSNSTFFVLLSLLAYLLNTLNKKKIYYYISLLSFIVAIFFSEKVFVFPFLLFVYEYVLNKNNRDIRKLIPFFLVTFTMGFYLMGRIGPRMNDLKIAYNQDIGLNNPLVQVPISVSTYLGLIFWPQKLTFYHSELTFTRIDFILSWIFFVLYLLIAIIFIKRDVRISWWLLFFLISLSPTLSPYKVSWVIAERYAYLASLGVIVFIAFIIEKIGILLKNQKISYSLIAFVVVIFFIRTIIRNSDWKNQDTLWLATAKVSPSSPHNHNNLGDLYSRRGEWDKAIEEFKTAIYFDNNNADYYHNLANVYKQIGKTGLALENFQMSILLNPRLWQAYQNLALIYYEQKNYNLSRLYLEKALEINPESSALFNNLGVVLSLLDEKQKAEEAFQKAKNLGQK